jgi:hypothetical protein
MLRDYLAGILHYEMLKRQRNAASVNAQPAKKTEKSLGKRAVANNALPGLL